MLDLRIDATPQVDVLMHWAIRSGQLDKLITGLSDGIPPRQVW
jgi:hypothetical protein